MPAAVARLGYLIRDIICYLISYRIRYSPSAATLTDVSTLTDMAEQLALGRKEEEEEEEEGKEEEDKEEEEVRIYGELLGRQEKGRRKM